MKRLMVPDDVAGLIRGLHPDLKRKVRSALDDVLADPGVGKALRDELAGLRSCRVARFQTGRTSRVPERQQARC